MLFSCLKKIVPSFTKIKNIKFSSLIKNVKQKTPANFPSLFKTVQARPITSTNVLNALSHAMRKYKPVTHGTRHRILTSREGLHRGRPLWKLTVGKKRINGRCRRTGRITVRGRGGGAKRLYRLVSFNRSELFGEFEVVRLEYDPNRSARIALVKATGNLGSVRASTSEEAQEYFFSEDENKELYRLQQERIKEREQETENDNNEWKVKYDIPSQRYSKDPLKQLPIPKEINTNLLKSKNYSDSNVRKLAEYVKSLEYQREMKNAPKLFEEGTYRYVVFPDNTEVGMRFVTGSHARFELGNSLPLKYIPAGMEVFNVDLYPGRKAQLVRSAGTFAVILDSRTDEKGVTRVLLRLPSLEQRWFSGNCMATIGRASNINHQLRQLGKAGALRWLGRRPLTRQCAKNACDHPHGGKHKGKGGRPLRTWKNKPQGCRLAGPPTRKKNKQSNKVIEVSARVARRKKKGFKG